MEYVWKAWDYMLDGVDAIAGFISRHPRKVAIALVVYVAYRLFSLVF
jgi:hypothetical protein